jgi:predicted lipoprotein
MRRATRFVTLLGLLIGMASCVPWTVRPIDSEKQGDSGSTITETPVAYIDSIWASKLLPTIMRSAVETHVLLDALTASPSGAQSRYGHCEANGPCYFVVKGEGVVTSVDTHSRVGLALVDIAPFDKRPDLSVQIGPVIRGTSLRDATGIIRFTDFTNQIQFADVGNELNNRVLKTVLAPLDREKLKGRKISFVGALSAPSTDGPPLLRELVPVTLTPEGQP